MVDGAIVTLQDNDPSTLGTYDFTVKSGGVLEINVKGTLTGSIYVESGGELIIGDKLDLNKTDQYGNCISTVGIQNGGNIRTVGSGNSDLLAFCGVTIIRGSGGGCDEADGSNDTSPPYCGVGGISGPTGFDQSGENASLPVNLLFFRSSVQGSDVISTWATASEENFDYFTIERSTDAVNYETVGTVKGNGWSDKIINYSFTDNNPLLGRSYYRLKSTDFDGYTEYFKPVMVNVTDGSKAVTLTSNPINEEPLEFSLNFKPADNVYIQITDLKGVVVYKSTYSSGRSRLEVDNSFTKGVYLLHVSSGGEVYTLRFIKN